METSPNQFDPLLTMKEVAQLLHCSKTHVSHAVNGQVRGCEPLPAIHIGRRLLVRRESLERWIRENEAANLPQLERKRA